MHSDDTLNCSTAYFVLRYCMLIVVDHCIHACNLLIVKQMAASEADELLAFNEVITKFVHGEVDEASDADDEDDDVDNTGKVNHSYIYIIKIYTYICTQYSINDRRVTLIYTHTS
jgi:hypothetical protein